MPSILIVDDNAKHCNHAKLYVNALLNCKVASIESDGHKALHYLHNAKILPDIILLDIEMKGLNGVITMEYIQSFFPNIKVIAFSSHCESEVMNDMFASGAKAYIWKYKFEQFTYLQTAIKKVLKNEYYWDERFFEYSTALLKGAIKQRINELTILKKEFKLTKRQEQVILLNAARTDFDYIGSTLHISKRTIGNTINDLNKKLHIQNGRIGLFDFALMYGFIKFPKFRKLRGGDNK